MNNPSSRTKFWHFLNWTNKTVLHITYQISSKQDQNLFFLNNCQNILEVESETWGRKRKDYGVLGMIMGRKGDHGIVVGSGFIQGLTLFWSTPSWKKPVYLCVSSGNSLIISQRILYHCQTLDLSGNSSLGWPLSRPSKNSPDPLLYNNGMVHLQWTCPSHPTSIIFYLLPSPFSAPVLALELTLVFQWVTQNFSNALEWVQSPGERTFPVLRDSLYQEGFSCFLMSLEMEPS